MIHIHTYNGLVEKVIDSATGKELDFKEIERDE